MVSDPTMCSFESCVASSEEYPETLTVDRETQINQAGICNKCMTTTLKFSGTETENWSVFGFRSVFVIIVNKFTCVCIYFTP